jgi:glutaredoxin
VATVKVTLFTKQDCGLCEKAEHILQNYQRSMGFALEIIDIEGEEAVYRRYWHRVPVVLADGKEVAEAPIDAAQLKAALTV